MECNQNFLYNWLGCGSQPKEPPTPEEQEAEAAEKARLDELFAPLIAEEERKYKEAVKKWREENADLVRELGI
ncbi:MAG: hypothetical protein M0R80_07640 [Proteobacteria bacterium]|jgi:hypothetical protein|nr:hypothetical protein [Pseudomonadota bacterium]